MRFVSGTIKRFFIQDTIYDQCPDHYFLTKEDMKFFWNMYAQAPGADQNPYASLDRHSEFQNLPPALIITAEFCPILIVNIPTFK